MSYMSRGLQIKTERIKEALEKTHGAIWLAAEKIPCHARTIQRRAEKVQEVREIIDKWRNRRIDMAEVMLDKAVANGEPWAIQFTLKTQGKDRGWVDRQELTGADGKDLSANLVIYIPDNGRIDE